ncbi:MAG: M28 family peptidase [Cyclobacteriaceae bacterium]
MKKLIVFAFVLLMAGPACSQQRDEAAMVGPDTTMLLKDLRILSSDSLGGRLTGSEGSRMAAAYIISRYEDIGLTAYSAGYRQKFTALPRRHRGQEEVQDTTRGVNLLGLIQGYSDSVIVISAHYDHVGTVDGEVYNGADDNASGVAVMLSLARYFASTKPEHTMIFAAFDAEEARLQGSRYFINSLEVDPSRIVLNVNMDMVSQSDKGELYASGTRYHTFLKPYLLEVARQSDVKLKFGHDGRDGLQDWTRSSDHGPFHEAGIPFIYFGVEDHPHYHKPTDTYDRVPIPFFKEAAGLIWRSVIALDQQLAKKRLE